MRARWLKSIRGTPGRSAGSALILTVVLTSLLAIVGVLFIMTARIDKMASSSALENEQLGLAAETVVSQINEALARDVLRVSNSQAYYDYPDANNPWLADLEPYQSGNNYYWRQITNLTGAGQNNFSNVLIKVIGERDPIGDVNSPGVTADADGDGVGDARWYPLTGTMSSKGKPIYAAVRIVDDGGMLNVNTARAPFNLPDSDASQLQINVAAVAALGGNDAAVRKKAEDLQVARTNGTDNGTIAAALFDYEQNVIWQYPPAAYKSPYTPFDVSDDLEMRYRFLLHHDASSSRAENWGGFNNNAISTPVDSGGAKLDLWYHRARAAEPLDPNFVADLGYYACRHIVTTYNMDRIRTPQPILVDSTRALNKMVNVNTAGEADIHQAVLTALMERNPTDPNNEIRAAQITANLRDYIDDDNQVSVVAGPPSASGAMFYGFERPCVYLSELVYRFVPNLKTGEVFKSYAIELYKPYFEDGDLRSDEWRIEIRHLGSATATSITWSGTRRFQVLSLENPLAPLSVDFQEPNERSATARAGLIPKSNPTVQTLSSAFQDADVISLQRLVGGNWLTVDYKDIPAGFTSTIDANDPNSGTGKIRWIQRDISLHKCVRRLWSNVSEAAPNQASKPNLGNAAGNYAVTSSRQRPLTAADPNLIQAYPANRPLYNIGELGMVFAESAYSLPSGAQAPAVLIDLSKPQFAGLFNYLTVMDPSAHGLAPDETRLMGRININTAPWLVLAQLPGASQRLGQVPNYALATAIVAYRDKTSMRGTDADYSNRSGLPGFRSVGELLSVNRIPSVPKVDPNYSIAYYALDNLDQASFPDLTVSDGATDDYEERDLIFARLSDLVTVRSDVFTAYILVRIGEKGPQKRMVALLDRSAVSPSNPKVRVIALYAVADPR